MKSWIYKSSLSYLVVAVFALTISSDLSAKNDTLPEILCCKKTEFQKKINREFSTTADGKVELLNQYGYVKVQTWAENRVKIEVTFVVRADNQSDANEVFDRLSVNFLNSSGLVRAQTMISSTKNSSWMDYIWSGWSGTGSNDFEINYMVWMPTSNDLRLENKYGNSSMADLNGRLDAVIQYGDLNTRSVKSGVNLTLAYGNGSIEKTSQLTGKVSYGDLRLQQTEGINLDTKYSKLSLGSTERCVLVSKYDELTLGSARDLRLDTKYSDGTFGKIGTCELTTAYTDIKIDYIAKSFVGSGAYSDFKIGNLGRSFTEVSVRASYTDVSITTEEGTPFSFSLNASYGDLSVKSGAQYSTKSEKSLVGKVGSGGGKITGSVSYGDITIR